MCIKDSKDLKDGQAYWYISVPDHNCHWPAKVLKRNFQKENGHSSLWNMLIFDDEQSARALADKINKLIQPYIFTYP